jgi:hypothetical protein
MRIRLIIYAFVLALLLDAGVYHGQYLRAALQTAQSCGGQIGDEVDNAVSKPFRRVIPGVRWPNA